MILLIYTKYILNGDIMFNEILKKLRKQKGVTQSDIAKLFDVGYTTISNWETGFSEPSIEQIKILADYFGVTVNYLLGVDNADPIEKLKQALKEAGLYNGDDDMSEEDLKKALQIVDMIKEKK